MLSVLELRSLIARLDARQVRAQLGPFALVLRPPANQSDRLGPEFYQQRTAVGAQHIDLVRGVLELVMGFDDLEVATLPPLADGDELTVGRAPDCDLVLDEPSVSKRHALLRWEKGACSVRDAGSTNGTFLNDARIGETLLKLRDGDVVGFGEAHFFFLLTDTLYARLKTPPSRR